ncbi:asparagine synthase (glutamine-hydrolyzing) [Oscillospiraceae bacterium CM]|nr:asparagine synthase (glutamine-hydrolyzing) [Oscillospiraceae bacterium CM]
MCGIAGLLPGRPTDLKKTLAEMIDTIRYRGPDETGFYCDGDIGLGHARLAVMDPLNGHQPAASEDGTVVVVFNGEIFNFRVLRDALLRKGHVLQGEGDTAVLPHLYEEYGEDMFALLDGQFAIAIWDKTQKKLFLARDRFGEKPLFYCRKGSAFCFASEAKALFQSGVVRAKVSPAALGHIFTFWTTIGSESVFEDIFQVMPGSYLVYSQNDVAVKKYWQLSFPASMRPESEKELVDELEVKLTAAVQSRMISDVPVSFYLSGGLDSSLITGIAARSAERLNTFSVVFDDERYDESIYQRLLAESLGTHHTEILYSPKQLPQMLGDVVYHTESPLLRAGAFPMLALSALVRRHGIKVVLSGEGADELFGGYDIFREAKIRAFCARVPGSAMRPMLYRRVNQFVPAVTALSPARLSYYYGGDSNGPFGSHLPRWKMGSYSRQFFSKDFQEAMDLPTAMADLAALLPPDYQSWSPVKRAQTLEMMTLFSNYLLSSQGDRMTMGHGVECRCPFLDNALWAFAASLPDHLKIRGLKEKYIVGKLAQKYVPESIIRRKKFPYRAPVHIPELLKDEIVRYYLSPDLLSHYGIFNAQAVERFLTALNSQATERDTMLFMGVLTTQALCERFSGALSI